jgi:hypothetical protein
MTNRPTAALFPQLGEATSAALFHGVKGAPLDPVRPDMWSKELPGIVNHRLAGLALAATRATGIDLDAETLSSLQRAHARQCARVLVVEARAIEVADALKERGIAQVVTKGPGIARAYPDPSMRPFGDIDVLVPHMRFNSALTTLSGLGFREAGPQPRRYFNRYCREAVNLKRDDGASLDLHHHIPPWMWGRRIDFADVLARSERLAVSGGSLQIACSVHNLMIAGLHVISDKGRPGRTLIVWRDIVSLSRSCEPESVVREARKCRLDWLLAFVLRELPPFARPDDLLDRLGPARPSRADAARLHVLLPPGIGARHQISQAFRLPFMNGLGFMAGYLLPSRTFLRSRFGHSWSYLSWWDEAFLRLREAGSDRHAG